MISGSRFQIIKLLIALVWFVNGLFCKILKLVPRHEQIVGRILGEEHARLFTVLIGMAELCMTIWILTGIWHRANAVVQILVILVMNVLEMILVPDLLLWGRWNGLFALLFAGMIYWNNFVGPGGQKVNNARIS